MQLGLGGPNCNSQLLCDFFVPVTFDIVQHKNESSVGWEFGDGIFEIDGTAELQDILRPVKWLQVLSSHHPGRSSFLRSKI